jgi:Peptidase family M48
MSPSSTAVSLTPSPCRAAIIVTRGLLEKVGSPEEVAGVPAHEIGHVLELHPETAIVRAVGLAAELILTGSSSRLANLGILLSQLSYNRAAEREAAPTPSIFCGPQKSPRSRWSLSSAEWKASVCSPQWARPCARTKSEHPPADTRAHRQNRPEPGLSLRTRIDGRRMVGATRNLRRPMMAGNSDLSSRS